MLGFIPSSSSWDSWDFVLINGTGEGVSVCSLRSVIRAYKFGGSEWGFCDCDFGLERFILVVGEGV